MKAIGIVPKQSNNAIALGNPALLSMDMSEAAAYCGVESPIQKRDRKSGARKRSQIETETERLSNIAS